MRSQTASSLVFCAWSRRCSTNISSTCAPSSFGAASSAQPPVRHRPRHLVRCLLRLGGAAVLHHSGLGISGARLRSAHRLSRGQQHPAAVRAGRVAGISRASGLSDACRAYGLEGWENIDKGTIAEAIGRGSWRGKYTPEEIMRLLRRRRAYGGALLRAQLRGRGRLPPADTERVTWWSNIVRRRSRRSRPAACRSTCRCGTWSRRTSPRSSTNCSAASTQAMAMTIRSMIADGKWSYDRFEQWLSSQQRCCLAASRQRAARH